MHKTVSKRFDLVLRGGRVIDPARKLDGLYDVGIRDGKIAAVRRTIDAGQARKSMNVRDRLVIPGMIDTHAHVYQYVTGAFGMNADHVGIRSGVTTLIDQGGASPLTIQGFRKFIVEPATTRVCSFVSNYLVGGLVGHRYTALYGPHGIDVRETVKAIEQNRDIVKGIKAHAEVGGYSRWGLQTWIPVTSSRIHSRRTSARSSRVSARSTRCSSKRSAMASGSTSGAAGT